MPWFSWSSIEMWLHLKTVKWKIGCYQGIFQGFGWYFLDGWSCCQQNQFYRNWYMLWALSSSLLYFELSEAWLPIFDWRKELFHLCLPTLTRMFDLSQKACTAARAVLTERKTVGLNLLKIACEVNIKKKVFTNIFDNYHLVWNHQVIPVSSNNAEAIRLIETTLKGLIINFK